MFGEGKNKTGKESEEEEAEEGRKHKNGIPEQGRAFSRIIIATGS